MDRKSKLNWFYRMLLFFSGFFFREFGCHRNVNQSVKNGQTDSKFEIKLTVFKLFFTSC